MEYYWWRVALGLNCGCDKSCLLWRCEAPWITEMKRDSTCDIRDRYLCRASFRVAHHHGSRARYSHYGRRYSPTAPRSQSNCFSSKWLTPRKLRSRCPLCLRFPLRVDGLPLPSCNLHRLIIAKALQPFNYKRCPFLTNCVYNTPFLVVLMCFPPHFGAHCSPHINPRC